MLFKKLLSLLLIVLLVGSCVGNVSARNYGGVYPGVDVICFVGEEFNVDLECQSYGVDKWKLRSAVDDSGLFEYMANTRDCVFMPLKEGVFDAKYNIRFCIY
jgi:hypothetical protein